MNQLDGDIREMYTRRLMSLREIAEVTGLSHVTVMNRLVKMGIPRRAVWKKKCCG